MSYISQYGLVFAAVALLIIAGILSVLYLQLKKRNRELKSELALQRNRVSVRKQKIYELRSHILSLNERIQASEKQLESSIPLDEMHENYQRIGDALQQLIRTTEPGNMSLSQRRSVMTEATRLANVVKEAFHEEEDLSLELEEQTENAQNKAARGKGSRHLLIVDDNDDSRRSSIDVIETCGFLVDQAKNGAEAVEKFRRSREGYYDIILMDTIMPIKDGYEATREIRKIAREDSERIPIIAITANSFSQDYLQLLDAGMNDHIERAFSRDSFQAIVKKWLHDEEEDTASAVTHRNWSSVL